jgi:hypothetical protein
VRFNAHTKISGNHALLSPSSYHWVNYDDQKMDASIFASFSARRGSELHDLAQKAIRLGVRFPDTEETINKYVNDCIGFRMVPEQMLFYSNNCFGTADAINFRVNKLRIFDLKTGITKCKITQLEIYAALFCLEYNYKPIDIDVELRLYQNDEVQVFEGDPLEITRIMSQIVVFDQRIEKFRMEAYG